MSANPPSVSGISVRYRFGTFELDARSAELRRNGVKLRLQEQPFVVLRKLLEAAGVLVTREELQSALWPADTFVDFDTSLNTAIKRLREVLGAKPAIVILEFGGNDGLRGMPISGTRANLEQMIVDLQKTGAKVVLAGMTLPRNYGPDYIKQFESVYKDLSTKYKLPLLPFLLQGVAGVPGMMQGDGIHATKQGNEVVAKLVMRYLKPLL